MKKVLFLGPPFKYYKGGAEYQYEILERCIEKNFNVIYLFAHPEELKSSKYIVYKYRLRKRFKEHLYTDSFTIYKLIHQIKPDIIYKQGINYITALGIIYSKLNNIKMILHIASKRDIDKKFERKGIKRIFDLLRNNISNFVIQNANLIICQAQYQNQLLSNYHNRKSDLILPNFHPLPDKPVKKAFPIKIIWISNFKKLKQPELFINLAKNFKSNNNLQFMMVGRPGRDESWQKKIFHDINNSANISYEGELPIAEVNQLLSQSHIIVNTSKYEGFPNTYIQAWMRKVPVVTLNCDPDDIIKSQYIGCHSKNFDQMVLDVKMLAENDTLREEMGERAAKYAISNYSVNNVHKLIRLLER